MGASGLQFIHTGGSTKISARIVPAAGGGTKEEEGVAVDEAVAEDVADRGKAAGERLTGGVALGVAPTLAVGAKLCEPEADDDLAGAARALDEVLALCDADGDAAAEDEWEALPVGEIVALAAFEPVALALPETLPDALACALPEGEGATELEGLLVGVAEALGESGVVEVAVPEDDMLSDTDGVARTLAEREGEGATEGVDAGEEP